MRVLLRRPPARTAHATFTARRSPVMTAADDQGLAPSLGHEFHPGGFLPPSWLVEVCELADVVDLKARRALAEFAAPGEEPVDQLVPPGAGHDGPLVGEGGCAHSPEGYPAEAGGQWLPAPVALDDHLQALARPGGGGDDGPVFPGHLADRRAVLARQRLEQRGLHDPVQPGEPMDVPGQQVVLDDAPILGPIAGERHPRPAGPCPQGGRHQGRDHGRVPRRGGGGRRCAGSGMAAGLNACTPGSRGGLSAPSRGGRSGRPAGSCGGPRFES